MQKFAFKWFKNLFPPFLGFFLIYYSYINTTAENKNTIYSSIVNADYFFVLIGPKQEMSNAPHSYDKFLQIFGPIFQAI